MTETQEHKIISEISRQVIKGQEDRDEDHVLSRILSEISFDEQNMAILVDYALTSPDISSGLNSESVHYMQILAQRPLSEEIKRLVQDARNRFQGIRREVESYFASSSRFTAVGSYYELPGSENPLLNLISALECLRLTYKSWPGVTESYRRGKNFGIWMSRDGNHLDSVGFGKNCEKLVPQNLLSIIKNDTK